MEGAHCLLWAPELPLSLSDWRALTFVLSTLPTRINQLSFFIVSGYSSLSKTITPTGVLGRLAPIRPSFFYHWSLAFLAACAVIWLSSHFHIWMWMSLIQFAHMISQTQEGTHLGAERCNQCYHCGKESPSLMWVTFCMSEAVLMSSILVGHFTPFDKCPFALDSLRTQFSSQMGLLFMLRIPDFTDLSSSNISAFRQCPFPENQRNSVHS